MHAITSIISTAPWWYLRVFLPKESISFERYQFCIVITIAEHIFSNWKAWLIRISIIFRHRKAPPNPRLIALKQRINLYQHLTKVRRRLSKNVSPMYLSSWVAFYKACCIRLHRRQSSPSRKVENCPRFYSWLGTACDTIAENDLYGLRWSSMTSSGMHGAGAMH